MSQLGGFFRYTKRLAFMLVVVVCAAVIMPPSTSQFSSIGDLWGVGAADAQERKKGLLELLFQRNKKKTKPQIKKAPRVKKTRKKTVRKKAKKRVRTARKKPPAAVVPKVEKAENANRILVIGDFVADGMSDGLRLAFAEVANVVVVSRTNGSSGLVRDDFYDWSAKAGPIIEELDPTIVVIMLGSNDRQEMRVNGKIAKVRSPEWVAEYTARVDKLIRTIGETNTPVMWAGSPPFRFRSMSADILAFNEIYRTQTEAAGGYFVDIWDGFVDEQGAFVTSGSDIKGQQVRLRAGDGINFTAAGKRKLAFYVERQLKQLLGDAASPLLTSLGTETAPLLTLPPLEAEADLQRTNPISVQDPDLDGGNILLGDINNKRTRQTNPLQAKSVRQRLVEDGVPPPSQPGRTGNFTWPG